MTNVWSGMMPELKGDGMRGLARFVTEIRNCKSKKAELKRINKELVNIRTKYNGENPLEYIQRKKYVCKLLFIYYLGYGLEFFTFGPSEAVDLLSSDNLEDKQVGYAFIAVLIESTRKFSKELIQVVKGELDSRNPEHVNLAIRFISLNGETTKAFTSDLASLAESNDDIIKTRAAYCLIEYYKDCDQQSVVEKALTLLYSNRLFAPVDGMDAAAFNDCWESLSNQEYGLIFPAMKPMDKESTRIKLAVLGCQFLDEVDPNPETYVCAGIVHTQSQQITALIRLDWKIEVEQYRLTIRSSEDTVSKQLVELIATQF